MRDLGTLRTSISLSIPWAFNIAISSSSGRVECPMVNIGRGKVATLRIVNRRHNLLFAIALLCIPAYTQTFRAAADLDSAVNQAVRDDKIPGAVLLIGHDGAVVYSKAYGNRALVPAKEPMTADTIFDIASLTKVVATTSCIMKLFEEGKIWIDAPVTRTCRNFRAAAALSRCAI